MVDKRRRRAVAGERQGAARGRRTEHGIVCAVRVLAYLAPFADELAVYPAAPSRKARTLCAPPSRADECAGSVHAPRQRSKFGRSVRRSIVEPLRRAGRLRDPRRRRGAARPRVHRRHPRPVQHGDDHRAGRRHPAADHGPASTSSTSPGLALRMAATMTPRIRDPAMIGEFGRTASSRTRPSSLPRPRPATAGGCRLRRSPSPRPTLRCCRCRFRG